MELIRHRINLRPRHRGAVVTIGNFDGVHLGHADVLTRVIEKSAELAAPTLLMCFEPTPQEYFRGEKAPARLMTLREKFEAVGEFGVDRFLFLRFNQELAALSAAGFVDDLLVRRLGARAVIVGDDFRFGRDREGDFPRLVELGRSRGFQVERRPSFTIEGTRVSSSAVRERLAVDDLDGAARFLGRPYAMSGKVVLGERLGRTLGYPTANLRPGRAVLPIAGIFAVRVGGAGAGLRHGVASLGVRPTVAGTEPLLEVHLFDFDADLYGRRLRVEFVAKLRDEAHFPDLEALRQQMQRDELEARKILAR